VTTNRTPSTQELVGGLSRLLGGDFSITELTSIAAELPQAAHSELVAYMVKSPCAPSASLGKAILDALVQTGIFDAKFGSPAIKDEYDAASTESVEDLYTMIAASLQLRSQ